MIDIKYATSNGHNVVLNGDSLEILKELEDNSIDSVVTDPPYGLSFMRKKWDYDVPQVDLWKEVFRVLKPGGHLLSFAGTRTYHRMAVNIEDAGFEIRDMISWLYGSGFPKSHNIGKAVDKIQGNERKVVGKENYSMPKADNSVSANSYGISGGSLKNGTKAERVIPDITKGNSQWEGWGTALKPACEPIVVARKPISEKNIALNVLKHGTGGININECRVGTEILKEHISGKIPNDRGEWGLKEGYVMQERQGRFPANIILDEEAGKMLDEQSGVNNGSGKRYSGYDNNFDNAMFDNGERAKERTRVMQDSGGASRFFYCAKASKSERNFGLDELEGKQTNDGINKLPDNAFQRGVTVRKNFHPTVKPIKLMQYLVRLVTPKNGVVLDPFAGSGTTGCACIKEGMNCILIERDEEYIEIINARLSSFDTKMNQEDQDE